jgi:transcriptional regulator with XRE-family HTH domain
VFASELRAQRQAREWTQAVLGSKIGYSASFVSDVERCERTPRLDFAQACDREMGLPGSFARLHELIRRAAYPAWFNPVIPFEAKAVRIHGRELGAVPGLLRLRLSGASVFGWGPGRRGRPDLGFRVQ